MYEIYSIGDAVFLFGVLNAIAALAQTDEYDVLAKIGLMLGVILVMVRAAMSGGSQFPVGQLLGCLLIYMAFFGPTRQVAVVDVYTGAVRTVDHVPAGIALAASQVSSFGYHTTLLMEQAFATPRMTEQGYGAALETLKRVRLATLNVYNLEMANAPTADADLPRSWQQYIADCPLKGVQNELRHKEMSEIWNTPLMTQGLRFESGIWGTKLDLTRPYTEPTCSEAYQQLVEYTNIVFLPYFKQVLARKLRYASVAELEEAVQDSLAALGLTPSGDEYIMTSALSAVYFAAVRQRYAEDFQPAYATAVDDAIQQRNAQWLADESLFQNYVRPMITFLEGFVFAMTPLLVLLVGLGPYGIQVISGFLLTLIWINTWMPVLAVINFFQHMIAAGKLEALAENGASVDTMAGLFQADSIVQTWLAVAGNMAAAVPALTGAFLFLGKQAFGANMLAQRLSSGQDTFKEEKAAPDSYHAGAMVQYQSPFTHAPQAGYTALTGAQHITPQYSWATSQQLAVASAETRSQGLSRSFGESAGRRIAEAAGSSESGVIGGMFNTHEAASKSQSYTAAKNWAASTSNEIAGAETVSDEMRTQIAYGLSAGLPLKEIALRLGGSDKYVPNSNVGIDGAQSSGTSNAEVQRIASQMADLYSNDKGYQAQFGSALAYDLRQGHEDSVFASRQLQRDQGLQRQASEVLGAQQEYRQVKAANAELGQRVSLSETDLVGMFMRDKPARDFLEKNVAELGLMPEVRQAEWGLHGIYPNPREKEIAAELRTLETSRELSDYERSTVFAELGEKLGLSKPRDFGNPDEHAGVGPGMDSFGEVQGKVAGMDSLGAGIEAGAKGELAQREQAVEAGRRQVAGRSADNNADVLHHQDINRVRAELDRKAAVEASKALGRDPNLATEVHWAHDGLKDLIKGIPEDVVDLVNPPPPSVTEQIGLPPPSDPKGDELPSGKPQPE